VQQGFDTYLRLGHVKLIHLSHVADTSHAATTDRWTQKTKCSWGHAFTQSIIAACLRWSNAIQVVYTETAQRTSNTLPVPYGASSKQGNTTP
jgi:hypothetical protein